MARRLRDTAAIESIDVRSSNNRINAHVIATIAMFAALASRPAVAAAPPASDPMAVAKSGVNDVLAVFQDKQIPLRQRREKLRALAGQYFDFDDMARSALGYHWRSLTPQQRAEFTPLFAEFIQDAYLSKMGESTVRKVQREAATANVNFIKETFDGPDYAQVFSKVLLREQQNPISVNYMMHRKDGQWRIYDVTVEAISIVGNYRNQFNRVINNGGYDKLIADLKAKRAQLRQYMDQESAGSAPG
jgi:phospholipid transport system substrate-binding protein